MPFDLFFTSQAKPKQKKQSPAWTQMKRKDRQKKAKRKWNARSIGFDARDA
jgi:hypothetical protein